MRNSKPQRLFSLALVALLGLTAGMALDASAQSSKGRIRGRVLDKASGNGLAGVTVTVTSPALQGEQTEFTDENGGYIITELPPGEYLVRFYFADIVQERPGVKLSSGDTLNVTIDFSTEKATAETVDIVERAPTIDVGSSAQKTVMDEEIVRRTPVRGRTYESVLTNAPGATTDDVGFSFNGATGPENSYMIDGLNTTNGAYGLVGTSLSLEFISETQIITGGYQAEFGRATGGLVNIVTKSGSNEFKGALFMNYTPFQLEARNVGRLGEALARRSERSFRELDFGFTFGGPIIKDRLWFFAGVAPQYSKERHTRIIQARTAANIADAAVGSRYLGDIDTAQACPDYLAGTELCPAGAFKTESLNRDQAFFSNSWLINYMGRLDLRINDDNTLTVQYLGAPSTFNGVIDNANDPNSLTGTFNADPSTLPWKENIWVHDVLGTYTSKLLDRKLQIEIKAGYHTEDYVNDPRERSTLVVDLAEKSLGDFEAIGACQVQVDAQGRTFNPCPVRNYRYGGWVSGLTQNLTSNRFVTGIGTTLFAELAGNHEFKLGGDFELNTYTDARSYTGIGVIELDANGNPNVQQFGTQDENGVPRYTPEGFAPTTESWRESVYLRDSWQPSFFGGFTLDLGGRLEFEQIKDVKGENAITLTNIAPRVGFTYDWTQKGLSKVFASYGRFYEAVPLDINDRQFTGEGIFSQDSNPDNPTPCQTTVGGKIVPTSCDFLPIAEDPSASINGGSFGVVSPSLKGQFTNHIVAGVEVDVGWDLVLGAQYVHDDLGRVVEDLSSDGANTYIIANPGEPLDPGVESDLQEQIRTLSGQLDPNADMTAQAKVVEDRNKAIDQLRQYRAVSASPKPTRDYNALILTARKKFAQNWLIQASYAYSRTIGNFPGLYQSSNGQLDPNISSQFDIPELAANRDGPLPNDRPHNAKLQVAYFIPMDDAGKDGLNLGLRMSVLSGAPIEVLGRHPLYGNSESFVLPRGAGGRLPALTSVDFLASYTFGNVELSASVFNLLNTRTPTLVDEDLTTDRVMPIVNGTLADLKDLKNTTGLPIIRNPNYGNPTSYQAPLFMRLGVRVTF